MNRLSLHFMLRILSFKRGRERDQNLLNSVANRSSDHSHTAPVRQHISLPVADLAAPLVGSAPASRGLHQPAHGRFPRAEMGAAMGRATLAGNGGRRTGGRGGGERRASGRARLSRQTRGQGPAMCAGRSGSDRGRGGEEQLHAVAGLEEAPQEHDLPPHARTHARTPRHAR